ncbi:MAG: SSU ribosomal protein S6p, partial [uncultured Nocardioidaceae bacterium]
RRAHRRPVPRHLPQRRPPGRRTGRECRRVGQAPPGLRDRQERRGHLRGHRPACRARDGQGARPAARAQRVGAAHQGHPARRPL